MLDWQQIENSPVYQKMPLDEQKTVAADYWGQAGEPKENYNDSGVDENYGSYLKAMSPSTAPDVIAMAEGRSTPITGMSRKTLEPLLAQAERYDNSFNANSFKQRADTVKKFTNGPTADSITSGNVALEHLDSWNNDMQNLKNFNNLGIANYPANAVTYGVRSLEQDPRLTTLNERTQALGDELSKYFKGSGTTNEKEVEKWQNSLGPTMSPDQANAAAKTMADLIHNRFDELHNQWNSGIGSEGPRSQQIAGVNNVRFYSPNSLSILKKYGVEPKFSDGTVESYPQNKTGKLWPQEQQNSGVQPAQGTQKSAFDIDKFIQSKFPQQGSQ